MIEGCQNSFFFPVSLPRRGPCHALATRCSARNRSRIRSFSHCFRTHKTPITVAALGERMNSQHALKGTPVEAHRLHVTLFDLGDYAQVPADKVAQASNAAASVAAPVFDVVFEKAMSYTKGALALCADAEENVSALRAYRQRLGEALADAGLKPSRTFTPHMAVAYARRKLEKHALEAPVRWAAGSLVLIDSHVGEGFHEVLGRWPEAARDAAQP
jgi:2'-5' RNA ligase